MGIGRRRQQQQQQQQQQLHRRAPVLSLARQPGNGGRLALAERRRPSSIQAGMASGSAPAGQQASGQGADPWASDKPGGYSDEPPF